MKSYSKPKLVAKNLRSGSYAAGCPSKNDNTSGCLLFKSGCKMCERTA